MTFLRKWPLWAMGLSLLIVAGQCSSEPMPAVSPAASSIPPTETPLPVNAQPPAGSEARDLLDAVQTRGYLKVAVRVWPEAAFSPPMFRNVFGALDGYEVDVAHLLADGLGVGLEMSEGDPRLIEAGNWQNEWDMALAWLPVTDEAAQVLLFSDPYATDRGAIAVNRIDQAPQSVSALSGKTIGVPANTVYVNLMSGQAVSRQGQFIVTDFPPDITVVPYRHDGNALRDLTIDAPSLDAVFHSQYMLETAMTELPIALIATDLYPIGIGAAFDRRGLPAERFRVEINTILASTRQNGRLSQLAAKWYGRDVSK